MTWIRAVFLECRLRKRFPRSMIYSGAVADQDSMLGEYSVLFRNVSLVGASLGSYSYVQSNSAVYNTEIGPFCSIAGGVTIGLAAHPTAMVSTSPVFFDDEQPLPRFLTKGRQFTQTLPRTLVGADVWIGHGALIKAGVKVGVGAVIGAGAIVTKDIAPYTVAAGNPCRVLRKRFPEDICQRLLDSRWWELDVAKLEKLAPLFSDPQAFLTEIESGK